MLSSNARVVAVVVAAVILSLATATVACGRGVRMDATAPSPTAERAAQKSTFTKPEPTETPAARAEETRAEEPVPAATGTPATVAAESPTPTSGVNLRIRIEIGGGAAVMAATSTAAGQAPEVGVQTVQTQVAGEKTVVDVYVQLDLGELGQRPNLAYSAPGAAPPRATAVPPVRVGAKPGDPQRGEQLFARKGCSGCHSTGTNTIVGPGLAGVGDRAGAEAYITESVRNPAAFVVPGFPNAMPQFGTITDQELNDLIAYLLTLK
ncbi:MAG: c-type cytochrome [Chloroflexi bacterium]|nr:c-type cytochrome [Chloroflexota bacterium]